MTINKILDSVFLGDETFLIGAYQELGFLKVSFLLRDIHITIYILHYPLILDLVAIAVPEMVPLLGFLTAFSITTGMLLIPILTETMTKWQTATKYLLAKNVSISFIWITLMVSVRQINSIL